MSRSSKVFNPNSDSQTIDLPANMRLRSLVNHATVRAQDLERIVTPISSTWDSFFLDSSDIPQDFLPTRARQRSTNRESL